MSFYLKLQHFIYRRGKQQKAVAPSQCLPHPHPSPLPVFLFPQQQCHHPTAAAGRGWELLTEGGDRSGSASSPPPRPPEEMLPSTSGPRALNCELRNDSSLPKTLCCYAPSLAGQHPPTPLLSPWAAARSDAGAETEFLQSLGKTMMLSIYGDFSQRSGAV